MYTAAQLIWNELMNFAIYPRVYSASLNLRIRKNPETEKLMDEFSKANKGIFYIYPAFRKFQLISTEAKENCFVISLERRR